MLGMWARAAELASVKGLLGIGDCKMSHCQRNCCRLEGMTFLLCTLALCRQHRAMLVLSCSLPVPSGRLLLQLDFRMIDSDKWQLRMSRPGESLNS